MTASSNNLIANAIQLDPSQSTASSTPFIDDNTTEAGEPGGIFQTVWWWFYGYSPATPRMFTSGSPASDAPSGDGLTPAPFGSLDTVLNVYEATVRYPTMASLVLVASNDNTPLGGGRKWSDVTFTTTTGKYYFVQVGVPVAGYKGQVHLNYLPGIPNALAAPISGPFATFLGATTDARYVQGSAGGDIPVTMPSGIQMGDQLVVSMANIDVNPVSIVGPSGWTGGLSTGHFWRTADGSEDGATLHWTTQDLTVGGGYPRVLVITALAYRFVVPSTNIFNFFGGAGGVGSATLTDVPGTGVSSGSVFATMLRVYFAFGQRQDDNADYTTAHPITGVTWTNPTPRTGLVTLEWAGSAGDGLNDATGQSAADVEYSFGPPFSVYRPHDAVTVFGGAASTAFDLETLEFIFPGYSQSAPYWGILTTPG